jgi:hypothetical protein
LLTSPAKADAELLAHVTETVIVTAEQIGKSRLDQAAALKRNLDWYREESTKAIGAPAPQIEKRIDRENKRSGLEAQRTHVEFVQARFLIELIFEALQKSLLIYHDYRWCNDFNEFSFILDRKLPTKLGAGEKYLNDVILPALGSRSAESLVLAKTWHREPQHPFIAKFRRERGRIRGEEATGLVDLRAMFGHGLTVAPSHKQAGLQLVDAVAYIVRRAILEPDNRPIQLAYDELRQSLRNDRQRCLTLERLAVGIEDPSSMDRYRGLSALARPH